MSDVSASSVEEPTRTFGEHYRELLPEFMALDSRRITRVNLEIPTTVSRLLAAHSMLMARAGVLKIETLGLDFERVKRLDAYAMALGHAHTLHLLAAKPSQRLAPLVEAATELRALLLSDVSALVQRDYLSSAELSGLRRKKGYKHLASDLLLLSGVLNKHFPRIQGRSSVSLADIERAEDLAGELLRAVGAKEHAEAVVSKTAEIRARAFTVVTRLYTDIRAAVLFHRRLTGDADSIAPSLFTKQATRKRRAITHAERAVVPNISAEPSDEVSGVHLLQADTSR